MRKITPVSTDLAKRVILVYAVEAIGQRCRALGRAWPLTTCWLQRE